MLTGITLQELGAKILANQERKKDFIADTRTTELTAFDDHYGLKVDGAGEFKVLPHAHRQIGARVGIHATYYDRMRTEAPRLLTQNVNHWFQANPERRMIRTMGTGARAYLSDRYNRIENEEVIAAALPVLSALPDIKIVSAEVTDQRMYVQAVTPRTQLDVSVGDPVQAGVLISNSEVGSGAATVAALIYRLRCRNGMVSADKFRSYHVGRQVEDSAELWADDTRRADDRAVLLKVRDMVTAAVDAVRFAARVDAMRGLTEARLTGDPVKAIEVLAKKIGGTTQEESAGILRALIEGADLSAYGLLNAITAQAHGAKDYDRSVDFESAGGQLLDLPAREWKQVLEAA